jgi:aminopeptidase-like protein
MKRLKKKIYLEHSFFSKLFDILFPINRSIVGEGYKKSLSILSNYIDFKLHKFPSGKRVFDWVVPMEWVIRDGFIITPKNKKICNFKKNNLHIMGYSRRVDKNYKLKELKKFLNSSSKIPTAIPYTTSYYKDNFGFNISHNEKKNLKQGTYKAYIDSYFKKGNLLIGEKTLKGSSKKDFLISSYLCHPSMANNELSGPLVLLGLYAKIKSWKKRRLNYRFLINPETIGSICFLNKYKKNIKKKIIGGLVLTCLGGPKKKISFKKTRKDNSEINKFFEYFKKLKLCELRDYTPLTGSDERQFCSPGFNLPIGQVSRTIYLQYKEYHSSLDNKKFMDIKNIQNSINSIGNFIKIFDDLNGKIIRTKKYSEIFLQRYNLYKDKKNNELTKTIIYLLGHSDSGFRIIDIILKYNLQFNTVIEAINILKKRKLIKIF